MDLIPDEDFLSILGSLSKQMNIVPSYIYTIKPELLKYPPELSQNLFLISLADLQSL
jgi:hypothetical protein